MSFFKNVGPFELREIADFVGGKALGYSDHDNYKIFDVTSVGNLEFGKIACLHNYKYKNFLHHNLEGVCVISDGDLSKITPVSGDIFDAFPKLKFLISNRPYADFGKIVGMLYPPKKYIGGISDKSCIDKTAKIGENFTVGNFTTIGYGVVIGNNCCIKENCVIEENVVIGDDCIIESNVVISNAVIGNKVFIKPGAKIGQAGFGFFMDEKGHFDVPQIGRVLIGNDVQIGSNTTIDRGSQNDTVIGDGCRIDNLVQIAHNVVIGKNSILVAQVGIAGSTVLGNFVVAAGQVGIAGHLKIGNGVKIAAQSGIAKDIGDGQIVGGSPAVPINEWHRQTIVLKRLTKGKN